MLGERKPLLSNLQFLADGDDSMGVEQVETPVESAANSQEEIITSSEEPVTEVINEPTEDKAEIAFARRLAAEREKIQAEIEGKYNPYKSVLEEAAQSYGFNTVAEYLEAYEQSKQQRELEQQAEEMNASPEVLRELNELKQKIAQQEQEKAQALAEQERQAFEVDLKAKVGNVLEAAKKDGVNITEEQILQTMVDEGIADPAKAYKLIKPDVDVEALKKNAVEEYFTSLKNGYKPVEGGGPSPVIINQAPKNFDEAKAGAREMLKTFFKK